MIIMGKRLDAAAVAKSAQVAERRAKAAKMRREGYTWQEIADACGYSSKMTAHTDVKRALAAGLEPWVDYQRQPIEELRAYEIELLARAQQVADEVMKRDHVAHSNGRVIRIEDEVSGEERVVLDDGPKLAAIDRVVKISESRRKLLGQDAPSKVETQVGGTVEYIIKVAPEELEQL